MTVLSTVDEEIRESEETESPSSLYTLKGKTIPELEDFFVSMGEPKFRAKQAFEAIYGSRVTSIDEITGFSKSLREKLKTTTSFPTIQTTWNQKSLDGTQKFTFEVSPKKEVEAVWIPKGDGERKTICISSQVGCTLKCKFCATGTLPFLGNLQSWQIVEQVLQVESLVQDRATNIVFMGMGEPMHNYFQVIKSAHILHHPSAFNLGGRRITISTAGVLSGVERFIKDKEPFNFAISLNHPNPNQRSFLMDVNDKNPLEKLLQVARKFTRELGRPITFEFVMIPTVNMGKENADLLVKIARSVDNCKINLIPLNTEFHGWRRPTKDEVKEFMGWLEPARVPVMNRNSPGKDIDGACGMLSLKLQKDLSNTSPL